VVGDWYGPQKWTFASANWILTYGLNALKAMFERKAVPMKDRGKQQPQDFRHFDFKDALTPYVRLR
jgi:hypothetical protein